jgi:malonyl-CoA/methylmalonyl-CoA synthetase
MTDALFSALERPDHAPAVIVDDLRIDRAQLARACAAHAKILSANGVRPGSTVAVVTRADPSTIVALVGNALAGAVTIPLNPALGARELDHVLRDADPRLAFSPDPRDAARWPSIPTIHAPLDGPDEAAPSRLVDDDPLLILYTSGTTGLPKGAVLSARNVASNLDALARAWALTERDRIAHALPLFHVHGLCLGLFGALRAGASLDWRSRFDPRDLSARLDAGATVLYAVPTIHHRLVELAEREPDVAASLRRARLLVSGSAPLSTREFHRIERACGHRVLERYGLTETLINCAVRSDAEPRPGWVGPAVDGVEVSLVDDDRSPTISSDGATLGEIRVRGPNVFAGYLKNAAATAAVRDADGWFYTGDLAVRDPDGWVRIVGRRATDLIKTGGFKVGAGEVESALREHPVVADCAVVGVEDDDLGERIEAFVVPREGLDRPSSDALIAHVVALASAHKRPRRIHWVAELPRNAMGKVLKPVLRAQALDNRGTSS